MSDDLPELPEASSVDSDALIATVFELHDAMDLFKEWSARTVEQVESEIDAVETGSDEHADLLALIEWVDSVRRRLVLSEEESLASSAVPE